MINIVVTYLCNWKINSNETERRHLDGSSHGTFWQAYQTVAELTYLHCSAQTPCSKNDCQKYMKMLHYFSWIITSTELSRCWHNNSINYKPVQLPFMWGQITVSAKWLSQYGSHAAIGRPEFKCLLQLASVQLRCPWARRYTLASFRKECF